MPIPPTIVQKSHPPDSGATKLSYAVERDRKKTMDEKISTPRIENLIYDVGMHRGEDSDYYLKKGFNVIGFEANPLNAAHCRERFAGAIETGQLTLIEGAITELEDSEQRKIKFYRNTNHSPWGSINDEWAHRNEVLGTNNEIIEVEAVNFRKCLQEYGIPYYLKADIVGSEVICLKALLEFENKPNYISIRSEKVIFRKLEEEIMLLEKLGYEKFKAVQQDVSFSKAPDNSKEGRNIAHSFEEGASGIFGKDLEGDWRHKERILKDYQKIFVLYWLFGDYSYLRQTEKGKKFIEQLERVVRRPLPGWYDTHAKHSSAV